MSVPLSVLAVAALGLGVAELSLRLLVPRADRWLDRPGERKVHTGDVPLVGGLAVLAALASAALLEVFLGVLPEERVVLGQTAGLIFLFAAVGIADDRGGKQLGALAKALPTGLGVAGLAGLAVASGRVEGLVVLPLAVLGFVVAHSFNTSDNQHGLCGGLGLLSALALHRAAAAGLVPSGYERPSLALAAALVPFLARNLPAGKVFLGDTGSLLLGAAFTAPLLLGGHPAILWLSAVPLADLLAVSVLRVRAGRRPWQGDRWHVSHRLSSRLGEHRALALLLLLHASVVLAGHELWRRTTERPGLAALATLALVLGLGILFLFPRPGRDD